MWRSFLAMILLPGLTAAQAAPEVHPKFSDQTATLILYGRPHPTATPTASYQGYTRFTAIRRGSGEDIGILLTLGGFVTARSSPVAGAAPLKVEFEPLDGFSIEEVHGPMVWKSDFKFQGETIPVSAAPYIQLKIRAAPNASLGTHVLKGKFTYQKVPFRSWPGRAT